MTTKVELLPLYAELQGHPKIEIIKHYARANVLHHTAPLQAEIEALRAEVSELRAARIAYASEFPEAEDGSPDTGNIHKNIRLLKARAERLAEAVVRADLQIGDGHIEAARITLHDAMGAALSPPKQPVALAKEDNND